MSEVLERLRHIIDRPTLYGPPEYAEGLVIGLSAMYLTQESSLSLDKALSRVLGLIREAAQRDDRPLPQMPFLCDEIVVPQRQASFEAFRANGEKFLSLLLQSIADRPAQEGS